MADLIDRQAAIDAMMAEVDDKDRPNVELRWWNMGLTRASKILEQLPSAEPKTGRWEMKSDPYGFFDEIPVCSECGCTTKWREKYLYCPNCGARMKGEADEH